MLDYPSSRRIKKIVNFAKVLKKMKNETFFAFFVVDTEKQVLQCERNVRYVCENSSFKGQHKFVL